MPFFKNLYSTISWVLVFVQLAFLILLLYHRVTFGTTLYYGNSDETNPGFEKHFLLLRVLLYSTFVFVFIWGALTPIAVISNRRLHRDKINIIIGILGFVAAVILLVADPFGIFKWFTS